MKKAIILFFLSLTIKNCISQELPLRAKNSSVGYDFNQLGAKQVFVPPQIKMNTIRAVDSGAIAYVDSTYWTWNGTSWNKLIPDSIGGGGGIIYSNGTGIVISGSTIKADTTSSVGGLATLKALRDSLLSHPPGEIAKAGTGVYKSVDTVKSTYPVIQSVAALRAVPSALTSNAYRLLIGGEYRDYSYDPTDNSSVDDSVMVIRATGGGTYKMIYNYIDPIWFGAIPNDSGDDTYAIQKAINFAINSAKIKKVFFGTIGQYKAANLVMAKYSGGQSQQITVSMEGAMNSNSVGVTLYNTNANAATIHIVQAQGIDISNILFSGIGPDQNNFAGSEDSAWAVATTGATLRTNHLSPYCAIDIDGFYTGGGSTVTGSGNQYPGMSAYYTNTTYAGSTNINIVNCVFSRMFVGVAEGLSGAPNGEGVHIRGGFGVYCAYLWAAGQLQSRENTIENFYFIIGHTFISNQFGTGLGDVPAVVSCNINYLKYMVEIGGTFTIGRFQGGYSEGIWSIGKSTNTAPVIFDKWNLTFVAPTGVTGYIGGAAPVLFEGGGLFEFNSGNLQTADYYQGMPFNSAQVSIINSRIQGGLPFQTNPSKVDNISFKGDNYLYLGSSTPRPLDENSYFTSNTLNGVVLGHLPFLPGSKFKGLGSRTMENVGSKIDQIGLGVNTITTNYAGNSLTFTISNAGLIQGGDVLYTATSVNSANDVFSATGTAIGYVSSVSGTTVTVSDIPAGLTNGSYDLYIIRFPFYIDRALGTVTSGSNSITGLLDEGGATFQPGDKIKGAGIVPGTYVTNVSGTTITLSTNANASGTNVQLYDAKIKAIGDPSTLNYFGITDYASAGLIWFQGDEIRNTTIGVENKGQFCIAPGKMTTGVPPTFITGSLKQPFSSTPTMSNGSLTFTGVNTENSIIGNNLYFDGTNIRYLASGKGSYFQMFNGGYSYVTAPSGSKDSIAALTGRYGVTQGGQFAILSDSLFGLSVNGKTYSYLQLNNWLGYAPSTGIAFSYNNVDKWYLRSVNGTWDIYNAFLGSTAFSIDSLTSKSKFFALASYAKNENGAMTNFSIPNKKYVDSLFALSGSGGGGTWGSITGTLSAQSDLNAALGLKAPLASPAFTGTPVAPTNGTLLDSTNQVATDAKVMQIRKNLLDSINTYVIDSVVHVGQGVQIQKSIIGRTTTNRTIGAGTGMSIAYQGDSLIVISSIGGGGDVYLANNNAFTGANTFINATYQSFVRSGSDGAAGRFTGNSTHYVTLGTDITFGQAEINGDARLDIVAGGGSSDIFIMGGNIHHSGTIVADRASNASSIATQGASQRYSFENSMWNTSEYKLYSSIFTRPSTTRSGLVNMVFTLSGTPNVNGSDGFDAMVIGGDSTIKFPLLGKTGGIDSSAKFVGTTGQLMKDAPLHSKTGTPVFTMSGGGTSPTITVTGNDLDGVIDITTNTGGTFGILTGTLTYATAYTTTRPVIFSASSGSITSAGLYGFGVNSSTASAGTVSALTPSTSYKITYHVAQP